MQSNTRKIEGSISFSNIEAQVIALLYAWGIVNDNEEVLNLDFGEVTSDGIVKYYLELKTGGVKVIGSD